MGIILWAELGTYLVSILLLVHSIRSDKIKLFLFLILDAFVFELVVVYLFPTLSYSGDYFLIFYSIPLMIACGWANLLYCLLYLFDQTPNIFLKSVYIAAAMSSIDLVMDKVAVLHNFWSWTGELNYFGIPFNNFFGWLSYSFLISFVISYLIKRESLKEYLYAFILISVSGLLVGSIWFYLIGPYQPLLWWVLYLSAIVFVLLKIKNVKLAIPSVYLVAVPVSFLLASLLLIVSSHSLYEESFILWSFLFSFLCVLLLAIPYWNAKRL